MYNLFLSAGAADGAEGRRGWRTEEGGRQLRDERGEEEKRGARARARRSSVLTDKNISPVARTNYNTIPRANSLAHARRNNYP